MRHDTGRTVVALNEMPDFKVADGDPDVRGWTVLSSDGAEIGEVDNLLVDPEAMKVRYLAVRRETSWFDKGDEPAVIVPIGTAVLDTDRRRVITPDLAGDQVRALPGYQQEMGVGRDYETSIQNHYGIAAGSAGFYDNERYDDRRFYEGGTARLTLSAEELMVGKRTQAAGAVDIKKTVETEHVRESVPVRHDEVTVERNPIVGDERAPGDVFKSEEVRIPLTKEELVVEKKVVPTEELVIKTRQVEEERVIEEDLRRERVDIDRETGRDR